jgi:S1-C subfamily serine protease
MKAARFVVIIMFMLCSPGIILGSGGVSIGNYPLPLVETEILLTRWLRHDKYAVVSKPLGNGEIVLQGAKTGKLVKLAIRAHSPLATEVELLDVSRKEEVTAAKLSWEMFMARSGHTIDMEILERIKSLEDAVVCISTPQANGNKMNFTGFFIDQAGTVLTIAHDLEEQRDFKLLISGGAVTDGHVVKSSIAKDLSVIESDFRGYKRYFPLKEGRSKLGFGDRIFMLCCNSKGNIQIQSGTVDKPKAAVSGQVLLQVKLEQVFFGSSGSPVVDEYGRLVGVVKGRFRGADSRGFLIPVDTVRSFVGMGK